MIYSLALVLLAGHGAAAAFVGSAPAARVRRAGSPLAVAETSSAWEGENLIKVPSGVLRANTAGRPWVEQRSRPRRNRKSENMRRMVRENIVTPADFIYPLFIHDDDSNVAIASMPGCDRHSLSSMVAEAKDAWQ